jgi:nitrogenase molybdenum-iron protein beta chain
MSTFIERPKSSCALGGALATLSGLNRVVPIVHAAGGCAAGLSGVYNNAAGYRGTGYCGGNMMPTTNIAENNVVFGGEDRLDEQIENTLFAMSGDLYVVVTGCQVEIIGDDTKSIAKRYADKNVISVSTPGFLGNTLKGYDAVVNALVDFVIEPSVVKDLRAVNIFGVVPGHDVFYRGNLEEIKRLLGRIGVRANTFFGVRDTVADIRSYGTASLSVVLAPNVGLAPAKRLQQRDKTPYIVSEIPIGPTGTAEFLRQVGAALGVESDVIESVIADETSYYYSYLNGIVETYSDLDFQRFAIISADGYYAHALTRFIANDLGWVPHLTSINDLPDEAEQEEYLRRFDDITSETKPVVVFEQQAGQILKRVRSSWALNHNEKYYDALSPAYVIGSGIDSGLAEKLGASFLSVAFPVSNRVVMNKTIAGLRGSVTLIEDLISQLVASR